jgi:hypothetical protein
MTLSLPATGNLHKMRTADDGDVVNYELVLGDDTIALNPYIGGQISIEYTGAIHCVECGRKTKKSFSQGHCFPCMKRLASCDSCIIKPELCHYHEGTCREPQWGETHCMRPHIVYLANSSGLKVGITRKTQVPTRWMDQGATQALPMFEVNSRKLAGLVEVAIARHVADKTDWRKMLRGAAEPVAMADAATALLETAAADIDAVALTDGDEITPLAGQADEWSVTFPVEVAPEKVKGVTLDKVPHVQGQLQGIKGQYLILDTGVFNVRRHGGYEVTVTATAP